MSVKRKSNLEKFQESGESSDDDRNFPDISGLHDGILNSASPSKYDGEEDDYFDVSSPGDGNSSTASGPIYVRTPGYKNHAHSFQSSHTFKKEVSSKGSSKKNKKSMDLPRAETRRGSLGKSTPRSKVNKGNIPMRMRDLPASFWQQPNETCEEAPGSLITALPPLFDQDDPSNISPVRSPHSRRKSEGSVKETRINVGNTELMLKLFDNIDKCQITSIRQGSKHKISNLTQTSGLISRDVDPCLGSVVLPMINSSNDLENPKGKSRLVSVLSIKPSSSTSKLSKNQAKHFKSSEQFTLPSLSSNKNYSKALSDLVINL